MRIISGRWKGLRIDAPKGTVARPTTDRVKESLFNLLGFYWSGKYAVDLFAGSGALGLEALSRGATGAVFVDRDSKSISAIRSNIRRCEAESESLIWKMDWKTALREIDRKSIDVGWVFVDPPYALELWVPVLEAMSAGATVVSYGVVCEHPKTFLLPLRVGRFERQKQRDYGDISVSIYVDLNTKESSTKDEDPHGSSATVGDHE